MPKGGFTQSSMVLLREPAELSDVERVIAGYAVAGRFAGGRKESWAEGNPSLTLVMRPAVNGFVLVELIDRAWPDAMNSEAVDAWKLGWFGPFVYPQALERSVQRAHKPEVAARAVKNHTAFIRVLSSYVLGAGNVSALLPHDYDALSEMRYLMGIVLTLLKLPQALAYFNPNGEVIMDRDQFSNSIKHHEYRSIQPVELWTRQRTVQVTPQWSLMDTIGMEQLGVRDHEACYLNARHDPAAVGGFLRSTLDFALVRGPIKNGDEFKGPGRVNWKAIETEAGFIPPARPTLRWFPLDGNAAPEELLSPQRR